MPNVHNPAPNLFVVRGDTVCPVFITLHLTYLWQPENLLVEVGAGMMSVKLVDFGDARHIYNNYYIHPMVGNPEFMSPEVISGTPVGLLTDIWSVHIATSYSKWSLFGVSFILGHASFFSVSSGL